MILLRKEAITILAYKDLISLDREGRESILIDEFQEDDAFENIKYHMSPEYNAVILDHLKGAYYGVLTSYIQKKVSLFFEVDITVEGKEEFLYPCPCCSYNTLSSQGDWGICAVCFWEDDGFIQDETQYSGANHMTLKEGRENFLKTGWCEPNTDKIDLLNPERTEMYARG